MPEFTGTIKRTITQTCEVTVTAADDEKATDKLEAIAVKMDSTVGEVEKYEWQQDDEEFEVEEVNEA